MFDPNYFLMKWKSLGVERLDVWKERRFATIVEKNKKSELLTGAFDRVVLGYSNHGIVIVAEIIDFKTDSISFEEQQERADTYSLQLEAYEQALKTMLPEIKIIKSTLIWVNC